MSRRVVITPSGAPLAPTTTPPPPPPPPSPVVAPVAGGGTAGGTVVDLEFLPPVDLEVEAEDELTATALSEGDDFIELPQQESKPFGRGWGFNFNAGRFIRYGSGPSNTRGLETLRHWVHKALITTRFSHPIYSDDFGIESLDVIGSQYTAEVQADLESKIKDALSIHDRITSVENFAIEYDPDTEYLDVNFTVVTDDEEHIIFEGVELA